MKRYLVLVIVGFNLAHLARAGEGSSAAEASKGPEILEQLRISYFSRETLAHEVSSNNDLALPFAAKPGDGVFRMDRLDITAKRIDLAERDTLTDLGRLDFAENRYISPAYRVTFGPLSQLAGYYFNFLSIFGGWHPNEAEAMTLYYEDERLRMTREMDEWARIGSLSDVKEAKELRKIRFQFRRTRLDGFYFGR